MEADDGEASSMVVESVVGSPEGAAVAGPSNVTEPDDSDLGEPAPKFARRIRTLH